MNEKAFDIAVVDGMCPHGNVPGKMGDPCVQSKEQQEIEASFSPKGYLESYYRPINVEKMTAAIRELRKDKRQVIDIRDIQKELKNLNEEEIENLFVLSFHEDVALELMRRHPEDGLRVLDIGGGPTIYQHIPLSLDSGNITHSEYLASNRQEIERWMQGSLEAHDWSFYFAFSSQSMKENPDFLNLLNRMQRSDDPKLNERARELEAMLSTPVAYQDALKNRLSRVVHGDLFSPGLALPPEPHFDVVTEGSQRGIPQLTTATFAFEGATAIREKWEEGFRNTLSRIEPGGYLSVASVRNAERYAVGEGETLPAASVNENDFQTILSDAGFEILHAKTLVGLDKKDVGYDGMVFIFAKRKENPAQWS